MKNKSKKSAMKVLKTKLDPGQKFEHALEAYVNWSGIEEDTDVDGRIITNDFLYEDFLTVLKAQTDLRIAEFRMNKSLHEQVLDDTVHHTVRDLKR